MKNLMTKNLLILAACVTAISAASIGSAQSAHHDYMDAHAAKMDLIRLRADRKMARAARDWGKVRQDDRLMAKDRYWIRKDLHRANNRG